MTTYDNVLFCPLGEQESLPALRQLTKLLDHCSSQLSVLGVVPTPSGLARFSHVVEDLTQRAVEHEHDRLSRSAAKLGRGATPVTVETGRADRTILDQVARHGHDLVVVTPDDLPEDRTTVKRLLRSCPAPIWVIRPTRARKVRALAAINLSDDERELNLRILNHAASLHEIYGGELHVIHAWQLYGEAAMRHSAFMRVPDDELTEMIDAEATSRARALTDLLAEPELVDAPWEAHLYNGPTVNAVLDVIDRHKINNLVLGTVARTGVAGLLIGNTAESILDEVTCSVIALKPPGFASAAAPTP